MDNKVDFTCGIILGTSRKGRQSEKVYANIQIIIEKIGINTITFDPRDYTENYTVPSWDDTDKTLSFKKNIRSCNALIIVIPEYNYSFPGELKILLDSAYKEYVHKPVGLIGVSAGATGGIRAIESIKPVLLALEMHVIKYSIHVPNVESQFDEHGIFTDIEYEKRVQKMVDYLTHIKISDS